MPGLGYQVFDNGFKVRVGRCSSATSFAGTRRSNGTLVEGAKGVQLVGGGLQSRAAKERKWIDIPELKF